MAVIRIFRCNLIGSQTGIGQRDLVNPPQMPGQGTQAYLDSWEDQDLHWALLSRSSQGSE